VQETNGNMLLVRAYRRAVQAYFASLHKQLSLFTSRLLGPVQCADMPARVAKLYMYAKRGPDHKERTSHKQEILLYPCTLHRISSFGIYANGLGLCEDS
jgi:hypothetical protein